MAQRFNHSPQSPPTVGWWCTPDRPPPPLLSRRTADCMVGTPRSARLNICATSARRNASPHARVRVGNARLPRAEALAQGSACRKTSLCTRRRGACVHHTHQARCLDRSVSLHPPCVAPSPCCLLGLPPTASTASHNRRTSAQITKSCMHNKLHLKQRDMPPMTIISRSSHKMIWENPAVG